MESSPTPTNSGFEKQTHEDVEISIWLDSYDEIFSDFDPRPYSKRTISDDFILQVRKVINHRYQKRMTLMLLLPESVRNEGDEQVISEHLHEHFITINDRFLQEKRKTNRKGLLLITSGIILMIIASYISFMKSESYYSHLLLILFEPAGWFMLWMGLDYLVYYSGKTRKELNFYSHMAKTIIKFNCYRQS